MYFHFLYFRECKQFIGENSIYQLKLNNLELMSV